MLFVVMRVIEAGGTEEAVFPDYGLAMECFQEAACETRSGATDDDEDVVMGAFLWAADSDDPVVAVAMAKSKRAVLLERQSEQGLGSSS